MRKQWKKSFFLALSAEQKDQLLPKSFHEQIWLSGTDSLFFSCGWSSFCPWVWPNSSIYSSWHFVITKSKDFLLFCGVYLEFLKKNTCNILIGLDFNFFILEGWVHFFLMTFHEVMKFLKRKTQLKIYVHFLKMYPHFCKKMGISCRYFKGKTRCHEL